MTPPKMTSLKALFPKTAEHGRDGSGPQRRQALYAGGRFLLPFFLLLPVLTAPAFAAGTAPASPSAGSTAQQVAQNQPRLTFPPASDCAFLGGDAGKRCDARRAGAEDEYSRVRSGNIKMTPGVPSSSGGTFTPLSSGGSLGGFGSSGTIAPSEAPPPSSAPYNPNSIGNAWSGTPYDNGTGMMPR